MAAMAILALSGCTDRSSPPEAEAPVTQAAPATDTPATGTPASADPGPAATADAAAAPSAAAADPAATDPPAEARNTDADVDQAIDTLLGDHKRYRDVFDRLKQGVASGDKAAVAALVNYPLEVTIEGKKRKIGKASEFVDAWDGMFTADVVQAVAKQEYRDVFVNWQGLMVGDGQVWINGICKDKECKKVDVGVTAVQQVTQ